MKYKVFWALYLSTTLNVLNVRGTGEIKDCFYYQSDYNYYSSIQLVCDGFNGAYRRDYCFERMFERFDDAWRSDVRVLKTGDCRGSHLNKGLPNKFKEVRTYDISFHGIELLKPEDFNFRYLTTFNASHNRLTNITSSMLGRWPELITIDFSYNNISILEGGTFQNLDVLNTLDLSNNFIETIDRDMFQINSNLGTLHLENNPIKRLYLNGYNWLMSVHVSSGNIKELETSFMLRTDSNNNEIQIKLDEDKILMRRNYNYGGNRMAITGSTQNIKYFNISNNGISSTQEVIAHLEAAIVTLDVSYNSVARNTLNGEMFENLINLKYLYLGHMQLSSIECNTFSTMNELRTLDISGNPIPTLCENMYKNTSKLKTLYLRDNSILKRIDCNIFWLLKNSVSVHVTWDYVNELDTSCLLNSLQLDLNDEDKVIFRVTGSNSDLSCTKDQFEAIQRINFAGNHLKNTSRVIEELGSRIESLDISFNNITILDAVTFTRFSSLDILNLSKNFIEIIDRDIFKNNSNLQKIDFSYNNISILEKGTFENLHALNTLDLSNNFIETIDKDMFQSNSNLETLHLENNPIKRLGFNILGRLRYIGHVFVHVSWENIEELDASCMLEEDSFLNSYINEIQIKLDNDEIIYRYNKHNYRSYKMEITGSTQNISIFNISTNSIRNTQEVIAQLEGAIETLDVSFNSVAENSLNGHIFQKLINLRHLYLFRMQLSSIECDTFSKMSELRTLDLSGNNIVILDENLLKMNSKLEVLRLQNNPLMRIDCNIVWPLKNSVLVDLAWDDVIELDTSCLANSLRITIDDQDKVIFRVIGSTSDLSCTKNELRTIQSIRFAGNQLQNTPQVIEVLGSTIETLDVSANFIGKLNETTFKNLKNLHHLNISYTQLSNFGFGTFYHLNGLNTLDISFNHLGKVDFSLLYRNFKNLETLNLEGNDLTRIDSVTRTFFPKLFSLGISKNNFSCEYLAKFLLPWQNLNLLQNPSDQTHIDGVDCRHEETIGVNSIPDVATISTPTRKVATKMPAITIGSRPKPNVEFKNSTDVQRTTENIKVKTTKVINQDTDTEDKPTTRFDCTILSPIMNSDPVQISCDQIEEIDTSCIGNSLKINLNTDDNIIFHLLQINSGLRCTKENFQKLKYLNISGNRIQNVSQVIALLGTSIETLDVSSNFIGMPNAQTFKKFTNLKYLNLSHTNLSSFLYATFFNQRKLQVLDLSFNRLKKVDFALFLRNFRELNTLNLEGNDLNVVDSVTRTDFPKLSVLGISKNHFSCQYLASFLRKWDSLQLLKNPSDETHIDGVDCYQEIRSTTNSVEVKNDHGFGIQINVTNRFDSSTPSFKSDKKGVEENHEHYKHIDTESSSMSADLRVLKYLFVVMTVMCSGYLVVKSKLILRIRRYIAQNSSETTIDQQYTQDSTHTSVFELNQRQQFHE